jgi:uncharacterized Rmd1/YagE family protein
MSSLVPVELEEGAWVGKRDNHKNYFKKKEKEKKIKRARAAVGSSSFQFNKLYNFWREGK